LTYVKLNGDVGIVGNGAGLVMTTLDMVARAGGQPANFLDIGGGASPERVAAAFRLVLSDPRVRCVLVNIFAGINRCDWVAQGIIQAAKDVNVPVPIVARLAGTNVEQGRALLRDSGLRIVSADTLAEAAEKAVAALNAPLSTRPMREKEKVS
ncbi:MAG: succinate--CoA ligase subunit beta, partial [Gemmatimonadales bacterium]